MVKWFALSLFLAIVVGCNPVEHSTTSEEPTGSTKPTATAGSTQGGGDGVQIHSMGAGAAAPVTGSDSVLGSGGGGADQAAKDRAKSAAAKASGGSMSQLPSDEGN